MIKIFWYSYFGVYLAFISLSKIKLALIRRKSQAKADEYAYSKVVKMVQHLMKKSKTTAVVTGLEHIPKEPCVFIGNHQAIFDGFLLLGYVGRPMGFIAKKEIGKMPLIGSWLRDSHTVFIDRDDPRDSVKAINAGVENLRNGISMAIFPEGTRSLGGDVKEFKKGSMKLALKSGAPIVPITIYGAYKVLEVGNKVRGNTIKMVVHKPIYVDQLSKEEQGTLASTVQKIIEDELDKIKEN